MSGRRADGLIRDDDALREKVFAAVEEYRRESHRSPSFIPGTTPIPPSGKVFDHEEMVALVDSALDFWLTADRYADAFEKALAKRIGVAHTLLTNSGSSANLLAVSALTSPELGPRRLCPGDEVITAAAAFPTTVNPLLQNGLRPVFVDVQLPHYNAVPERIAAAIGPRTKAIVLAHTLGNPFDAQKIAEIARRRDLWLIEDCCDALGSDFEGAPVAGFGDIATFSFYPAHHITMGEGGAVATRNPRLKKLLESFRDWGRDCWCAPGRDDTCGKRFKWKLGDLPEGYDHKYTYSHAGYNLKATEMQAAIGLAQMRKLDGFIAARRRNFGALRAGLAPFQDRIILPEELPAARAAWFGFPITVRDGAGFKREELTAHLERHRIGTRLLFAGNVVRQPYFAGRDFGVSGDLKVSDKIMRDTFWIGVFPGITPAMIDYVLDRFKAFFERS